MGCNPHEIEVRRNPYTKATEKQKEALKEAMNVKWQVEMGTIETLEELGEDTVRKLLGWVDLENAVFTADMRKSVEGKNRAIERSVKHLLDLGKEIKQREEDYLPTDIYFDWFIAKSNRMMIDSAEVNPQSDKLHRFAMHTKAMEYKVDPTDDTDAGHVGFKIAVAQAFGVGIDKATKAQIMDKADKILDIDGLHQKLKDAIKEGKVNSKHEVKIDEVVLNVEHLSHAIHAAREVDKFNKGEKFRTRLPIEVDGLTNGFALKTLQMPVMDDANGEMSKTWQWLSKAGIIVGDRTKYTGMETGGMNDIQANKEVTKFRDGYETLGSGLASKEGIRKNFLEAVDEKTDKKEFTNKAERIQKMLGAKDEAHTEAMIDALLPLMPTTVIDDAVTKEGRALSKGPFMTSGYGAGDTKIRKELAYGFTDELVQKAYEYMIDPKLLEKYETDKDKLATLQDNIARFVEVMELEQFKDELATKSLKDLKYPNTKTDVKSRLETLIGDSYGETAIQALKDAFGEIKEANNAINGTVKLMFKTFKKLYDKELEKYPNASQEDKMAAFKAVRDAFPILKGPLSKGTEDGIALFSTTMITAAGDRPGTLLRGKEVVTEEEKEELTPAELAELERKTAERTTNVMEREVDEAGASGSVIPIHTLDASIMTLTMLHKDLLEVHDAMVLSPVEAEQVALDYNTHLIELSKQWSMMEELLKSYEHMAKTYGETLNEVIEEEMEATSEEQVQGIIDNMQMYTKKALANREKIFNTQVISGNMIFNEESMYVYNKGKIPEQTTTEIAEEINPITDEIVKLFEKANKTKSEKVKAKVQKDIVQLLVDTGEFTVEEAGLLYDTLVEGCK